MNILECNGYQGTAEVDMERGVLRGKILFVSDLVTYEAENPAQLRQEFEAAVADYLETCKALGRQAQVPASGSFNVRVGPDLHRAAQVRAAADKVSLNDVMIKSLSCYLSASREVREKHVEKHYLSIRDEQKTLLIPLSEDVFGGGVARAFQ